MRIILYTSEVVALISLLIICGSISYYWQFFGHFLPPLAQIFNFFLQNYSFLFQFFGKPMKQPIAVFGYKKCRKPPKRKLNFSKNWVIEANLGKFIGLTILKMWIKKILYWLAFICLFHVAIAIFCRVVFELVPF